MIAAQDLRRLRWHSVASLILVAAGGLTLWRVHNHHEAAATEHERTAARLQQFEERYRRAVDDEDDARALLARLDALQANGALGPERRLDWIESLRRIGDAQGIPSLRYEIRPQRPLGSGREPGPRLVASGMSLELGLVHEGQLLSVFDALEREPSALVVPRGCTIDRQPPAEDERAIHLRANCEVDWITIQPAAGESE